MTTHDTTHELTLSFSKNTVLKNSLIQWFQEQDITSYVEGVIDDLDLDNEFSLPSEHFYEEQGGDSAPMILCSFDENYISGLHKQLKDEFPSLQISQTEMKTETWQNGWKDSFPTILTEYFRIIPIWEDIPTDDKINILVEPGMAFGTGQHASTQVCLQMFEILKNENFDFANSSALDVGTGSGILAIALAKLGVHKLCGTDIDKDALIAAKSNANMNSVSFEVREGSVPSDRNFDFVVANILFTVLAPMLPQLSSALNAGGRLLLSGLIEEQAEAMIKIANENALEFLRSETVNGWVCLMFTK